MTAYRLHFEPLFLEVLDIVRSGKIGEPRYFTSSFSMHAKPGGIRTKRELGGGTLYDLGVYCINTARLMFGAEPTLGVRLVDRRRALRTCRRSTR